MAFFLTLKSSVHRELFSFFFFFLALSSLSSESTICLTCDNLTRPELLRFHFVMIPACGWETPLLLTGILTIRGPLLFAHILE
jgi:hypothetical protein